MEYSEDLKIVQKYKEVAVKMLSLSFPRLGIDEIDDAVNYSIIKRMKDSNIELTNNYLNKNIDTSLLEMSEYILEREPIITGYGVMFKKHADSINPIARLLDRLLELRAKHKDAMFQCPKGSEEYEKYNLLQLLAKLDK